MSRASSARTPRDRARHRRRLDRESYDQARRCRARRARRWRRSTATSSAARTSSRAARARGARHPDDQARDQGAARARRRERAALVAAAREIAALDVRSPAPSRDRVAAGGAAPQEKAIVGFELQVRAAATRRAVARKQEQIAVERRTAEEELRAQDARRTRRAQSISASRPSSAPPTSSCPRRSASCSRRARCRPQASRAHGRSQGRARGAGRARSALAIEVSGSKRPRASSSSASSRAPTSCSATQARREELRERSSRRAAARRGPPHVLRAKIDRLGPVNMMAIEQFDELETRHAFLTTQRKDLVDSIAQTKRGDQAIDETTRERFARRSPHQPELPGTFSTLFGGGRAGLTLLDENDPLESGIDIIAQPPGKRLQSVQLLSGGEKALTAIALMFAIFKYKPSPFCLLDEIDAPLDDANIGRFVEMLRACRSTRSSSSSRTTARRWRSPTGSTA
jgi:chromosome segregation protein